MGAFPYQVYFSAGIVVAVAVAGRLRVTVHNLLCVINLYECKAAGAVFGCSVFKAHDVDMADSSSVAAELAQIGRAKPSSSERDTDSGARDPLLGGRKCKS